MDHDYTIKNIKIMVFLGSALTTFATDFATDKIHFKMVNPVSVLLTGLYKCGADETRTRDLLRDRQAF